MLVTFGAAASVSFLNWPCHQNEHLKIFLKKYIQMQKNNEHQVLLSVPRKYQLNLYIFSIRDKNRILM